MNTLDFDKHRAILMVKCSEILNSAKTEYSADADRFQNFSGIAAKLELSKEKILLVYLQKHIDGIYKYVNGNKNQRDSIGGRIADAINYLTILYCMEVENDINVAKPTLGQLLKPKSSYTGQFDNSIDKGAQ